MVIAQLWRVSMKNNSLFLIACLFTAHTYAADVPESVKICMDCHGNNGVSLNSDVPTIAGASNVFLEETLFAYKDKIRPVIKSKYRYGDTTRAETDMKQIARKLDYNTVIEVAEFFSSKPFVAAKQEFNNNLVSSGKITHEEKCQKCHGKTGRNTQSDAGILAGQWTPYLQSTMEYLRDGRRDTDSKMKEQIANLTEEEWLSLLAYYASQQD